MPADLAVGPRAVAFDCAVGVRAVKALRVAPPALRAAGGLDRVVRQSHAAIVDGPREQRPHRHARRLANLLTTHIGGAIVKSSFAGCASQPPPRRPMRSTRIAGHRSRFVLISRHTPLVDHSRDHRSADHAIVAGLRCGLRSQREIPSLDARAHALDTSRAHVSDLQS